MLMKVVPYPSDEPTIFNCALLHEDDMPGLTQIKITINGSQSFLISANYSVSLNSKEIGLCGPQMTWMNLEYYTEVDVTASKWDRGKYLESISIEICKPTICNQSPETYDADKMVQLLIRKYCSYLFSKQQLFPFDFEKKTFVATVLDLMEVNEEDVKLGRPKPKKVQFGTLHYNTKFSISSRTCSLRGDCVVETQSIIAPDFDFNELGIGGLDNEISELFRRVFTKRLLPANIVEQFHAQHAKGVLLYGPPGTGKTLIARKISGMLTSHPPKAVNGPEILNKFVGESEANVRRLFAEAEEEEKRLGPESALHVIIFEEIDAICKQRSSVPSSTGVHETVVNQLLTKMDGYDQLNNILIIGTTNRIESIDKAMLRRGRFDMKIKIGLPDEQGRLQILKIHTALLKKNDRLDTDVNLEELAKKTKNFTGADIYALVEDATTYTLSPGVKLVEGRIKIDKEAVDNKKTSQNDFLLALKDVVRPAFISSDFEFEKKFENMKYENERLRQALANSSVNANKWEQELNSALQEITSNFDEWKRQLQIYKEKITRLMIFLFIFQFFYFFYFFKLIFNF